MITQTISIHIHPEVEAFLKDCNDQILQNRIGECIDKIAKKQFDGGLRVKKLKGISRKIWEARINQASRLLFTYSPNGLIIQDICLDHDDVARRASARTKANDRELFHSTNVEEIIGNLDQDYASLTDEEKYSIEMAREEDLNLPEEFLSSLYNTGYKVVESREQYNKAFKRNSREILLTVEENKLVKQEGHLLISGSAGTGKTTVGLYRLINWAKRRLNNEKEGKALYIAYNSLLVKDVQEQFERLLRLDEFEIDSQKIVDIIEFQTIEDLCETIIKDSRSDFLKNREKLNYNKFEKKYEKKTNHKKGDPAYFIWEEIRGVIKGSHLETTSPLLSVEEYEDKGKNRSHIISSEKRPKIHQLVAKWYQGLLKTNNYYDEIDLAREALKIIRDKKFKPYNLIVCDEVQDFTEIQLRLLIEISKKDSQFTFAGDLNQMISPSGFRWEDLKVNLRQQDFLCEDPDFLSINFRNVQSLANLAHQLLKLRFRFLNEKDKLDNIEPTSEGELAGLIKHPFSEIANTLQDIQANEGIIVKNEADKEKLKKAFQSDLIFTVEEAKGLEFDTVFLIDFFVEKQELWKKKLHPKRRLKDNEISELAREFNLLYVAITRARQQLYIWETSLSEVWQEAELNDFVKESDLEKLNLNRKNSTSEDWKKQGIMYLNADKYDQAIECFQKGGDICLELEQEARAKLAYENEDYETAADYYELIEKWDKAAKAWEKATQYEQAGKCWEKYQNWQKAIHCYERSGNSQKINELKAIQLEEKGDYSKAAKLYQESSNIQKSVDCWVKASESDENNVNKIKYLEKAKHLSKDHPETEIIQLSIEETCQRLNRSEVCQLVHNNDRYFKDYKLDDEQRSIAKQIPPGPQRIRGIAGSGKTAILCRRLAEIHVKHPDWNIALIYWNSSLYQNIERRVDEYLKHLSDKKVTLEKVKSKVHILQLQQGKGNKETEFFPFIQARFLLWKSLCKSHKNIQDLAQDCWKILENNKDKIQPYFDAILIDEGQDLVVEDEYKFEGRQPIYWLAWLLLKPIDDQPHLRRLYWAYDELQNLTPQTMIIPEFKEIFGDNIAEKLVGKSASPTYKDQINKSEIIKCAYRTPNEIFVTAITMGLGLLRDRGRFSELTKGQLTKPKLQEIGFEITGDLRKPNTNIEIWRKPENSKNTVDQYWKKELVEFEQFKTRSDEIKALCDKVQEAIDLGFDPYQRLMIIVLGNSQANFKENSNEIGRNLRNDKINYFITGTTEINQPYDENNKTSTNEFWHRSSVTITSPYKAKGNEANWVFLLSLDQIAEDESDLKLRKQLFTAMTRTKAFLWISGLKAEGTEGYSLYEELEQAIKFRGKVNFINKTDQ